MKVRHNDERRNLHARNLNISCGSYSFPADLSVGLSSKMVLVSVKTRFIYAVFHIIPLLNVFLCGGVGGGGVRKVLTGLLMCNWFNLCNYD